jgi:hypothetical protein
MPIQFTCPHCGARTDVADEYAGQSGPCAACGETITVPPLAAAPGQFAPAKSSQTPIVLIIVLLVVVLVGGLLVCGGAFFWLRARPMAVRGGTTAPCINNLKQIGLAMHNYHDAHGCFPPAYIPDENGKPMHSWRVLLLPYLELDGVRAICPEYVGICSAGCDNELESCVLTDSPFHLLKSSHRFRLWWPKTPLQVSAANG